MVQTAPLPINTRTCLVSCYTQRKSLTGEISIHSLSLWPKSIWPVPIQYARDDWATITCPTDGYVPSFTIPVFPMRGVLSVLPRLYMLSTLLSPWFMVRSSQLPLSFQNSSYPLFIVVHTGAYDPLTFSFLPYYPFIVAAALDIASVDEHLPKSRSLYNRLPYTQVSSKLMIFESRTI